MHVEHHLQSFCLEVLGFFSVSGGRGGGGGSGDVLECLGEGCFGVFRRV